MKIFKSIIAKNFLIKELRASTSSSDQSVVIIRPHFTLPWSREFKEWTRSSASSGCVGKIILKTNDYSVSMTRN